VGLGWPVVMQLQLVGNSMSLHSQPPASFSQQDSSRSISTSIYQHLVIPVYVLMDSEECPDWKDTECQYHPKTVLGWLQGRSRDVQTDKGSSKLPRRKWRFGLGVRSARLFITMFAHSSQVGSWVTDMSGWRHKDHHK